MSLRSAYSTIFQPVLQDGTPFQGQINASIPGNVAIGDSNTNYVLSINGQTITSTSGSLNISGDITATGTLNISSAVISNVLNVSGITTVSALNVQNYLNVSGLTTLGTTDISGNVNISGSQIISSNLDVNRSLSAESVYSVTLSGVSTINGAPYVAGGNPFNWSTRPAISDVNMAGYSISGIHNLTVSNNATISGDMNINSSLSASSIYSSTISGVTLINGAPYIPGVSPANWSTFPAVTNVSMGGFNIGNINAISMSGRIVVDGSATINGLTQLTNTNISGLLNVSGGNVQNKWNVSGHLNAENASIVANLGVSGDTVLSNAYITALYGGTTTLSSLNVQSNVSISGTMFIGSNVSVSGNLNISGLTTLSGLTVENTISAKEIYITTISGLDTINGNLYNPAGIPSNWAIFGAVSDVNLSGNDIYNVDNLNVSGLSTFAGGITIPALATISHANVVGTVSSSNVYVSNVLNVSGLATLSGLIIPNVATMSDLFTTNSKIHIGQSAGFTGQSALDTVAIGSRAGHINQASYSIAIGQNAGYSNQASSSIAIGLQAGQSGQSTNCIAIGSGAGSINQQWTNGTAIGQNAGKFNQGSQTIAIGTQAGESNQLSNSIAIGRLAGNLSQGSNSIAIGNNAGQQEQGLTSIAIGVNAGTSNQISNSIILNATGSALNAQTQSGFYVAPMSQSSNLSGLQLMTYNPITSQIQQNSNITISGGNVGIGTTTPDTPLHLTTAATGIDVFRIKTTQPTGFATMNLVNSDNINSSVGVASASANSRFYIYHAGTEMFTISAYKIGINCNTPAYTLEVNGTCKVKSELYVGNQDVGSSIFMGAGASGDSDYNNSVIETRGYTGTECTELLLFKGNDSSGPSGPDRIRLRAGQIDFDTYPSPTSDRVTSNIRMSIVASGNVGINCNAPGYTLDVNGTVNCTTLRTTNPIVGPAITNVAASGSFTDAGVKSVNGYNFGSVSVFSTGIYIITFTTALPSTTYIVMGTPNTDGSGVVAVGNRKTTGFEIYTRISDNKQLYPYGVDFIVFN